MSCLGKITADLARPADKPLKGLEQVAVVINIDDLPRTGMTEDGTNPDELLTALALNSGTTGYSFEFPCSKNVFKFSVEEVANENAEDGFKHICPDLVWPDVSVAGLKQLNDMIRGRFYVVAEGKWKGVNNANAFWFLGKYLGMQMKVVTWNSEENGGLPIVTFETPEGLDEPYAPCRVLDTDYATTKTAFGNKFAAA